MTTDVLLIIQLLKIECHPLYKNLYLHIYLFACSEVKKNMFIFQNVCSLDRTKQIRFLTVNETNIEYLIQSKSIYLHYVCTLHCDFHEL